MKTRTKNILKGIGSIFNIAPSTNYNRFISKYSSAQRINNHWVRTGKYLSNSIQRYSHEQEKEN